MSLPFARLALVAAVLLTFLVVPVGAAAEVQTIEFETGADNLPLDGQGDISFPKALGFRPYKVEVGSTRAQSGTHVGDLGRCAEEAVANGGNPGDCEFFQANTTGILARGAKVVSLFAGFFGPIDPTFSEQAVL